MSDLNLAPTLLVHTSHRAVSGPYHRNGDAILSVYDFFQTDAQTALKKAAASDITYVVTCAVDSGIKQIAPDHLNARIEANDLPDWLETKSPKGARLVVLQRVK